MPNDRHHCSNVYSLQPINLNQVRDYYDRIKAYDIKLHESHSAREVAEESLQLKEAEARGYQHDIASLKQVLGVRGENGFMDNQGL